MSVQSEERVAGVSGRTFTPTPLDLGLATVIALGLPVATTWLLERTGGATASLLLYYGVACVLVVRWRRGALGYGRPVRWPWPLFLASLLLPLAITAINWNALPNAGAPPLGVALTALIWAPLNAALEQLSWVYVLDAWRYQWSSGWRRWLGLAVGIVLMVALVALIHALFWSQVLPLAAPTPWSWASIPLNLLLTASYVLLYDRAGSMWPTFVIHTLVDLQLVLLASYSLGPYL